MNRRQFVAKLSALATAIALPKSARAALTAEASWQHEFHAALQRDPGLLGWLGTDQDELRSGALKVKGKIPPGLRGTLYRNGPARHEIGDFRYHHWFDGDGMVQAFAITNTIVHHGRFVQTDKYKRERAARKALFAAFGTNPPNVQPVRTPDSINPANISMLSHHGKLFALWEAGSPHEIDARSLDTVGVTAFSPETMGVPFSAHPRVEPDGTLWNFGYLSGANTVVLWHIDSTGKLVKTGLIKAEAITMIHDCVVTERSLVLLIPPFQFVPNSGETFLEMHHWRGDQPTRVLVVDKNDFSNYRWFELPAQWVFHFGNGHEDDGIIEFDGARSPNADAVFGSLKEVMRGRRPDHEELPPTHTRYRVDLKEGTTSEEPLNIARATEFPCIDPRLCGRRHQQLITLANDSREDTLQFDSVIRFNLADGTSQRFQYGASERPEEHLYVPDTAQAPEHGGWILGTVLDCKRKHTRLNIFAADHLADGPVASAELPYALPLGLHGKFVTT